MNNTIKVLRTKDLIAKIGMARSTIYDWLDPKPFPNRSRLANLPSAGLSMMWTVGSSFGVSPKPIYFSQQLGSLTSCHHTNHFTANETVK